MPFASLYGFKKRGEEEEREPETHEEKRARMDARSRQRAADRVCVPPAAAPLSTDVYVNKGINGSQPWSVSSRRSVGSTFSPWS